MNEINWNHWEHTIKTLHKVVDMYKDHPAVWGIGAHTQGRMKAHACGAAGGDARACSAAPAFPPLPFGPRSCLAGGARATVPTEAPSALAPP